MIIVQVCVGSSCYLKGSSRIVELLKEKIEQNHLEDEIVLTGAFCSGRCNRIGVTITVDDDVYTGVTAESFEKFWENTILPAVEKSKEKEQCPNV